MRVSRSALAWLSVFVSLTASSAVKAQIVVDTCGQIVNGAGLLTADLDCSAESVAAGVVLTGTLYLEGFTLTAPMGGDAVGCGDKCRVQGPGTVRGHVASFGGVVKLSGLSMDGSPLQYAVGHPLKLKLVGVTMSGYDSAIEAQGRMKIVDSQLTGSGVGSGFYGGSGIVGERIGLIRSSVTASRLTVLRRLSMRGSSIPSSPATASTRRAAAPTTALTFTPTLFRGYAAPPRVARAGVTWEGPGASAPAIDLRRSRPGEAVAVVARPLVV